MIGPLTDRPMTCFLLLTLLAPRPAVPDAEGRFWLYRDGAEGMPFTPYGWMPAEAGQMLTVDYDSPAAPHDGERCMAWEFNWREPGWLGVGFFAGPADPPWWGDDARGWGYDLSAFNTLVFWARGEAGGEVIRAEVGTLAGKPHGDSLPAPVAGEPLRLSDEWQEYSLDLAAYTPEQRRRICAGLTILVARDQQPPGTARTRFYLDTVYYTNRDVAALEPLPHSPGLPRLREAFATQRFVAYTPTSQDPTAGVPANPAGIRADLTALRPYFDAVVTYSSDPRAAMDSVVPIAAELGMQVVLGIWNVGSEQELAAAVLAARTHPETVLAVLVGNETQLAGRATPEDLEAALTRVREALPGVPVSTSEPPHHLSRPSLQRLLDFHAPNIHWLFAGGERTDYEAAVRWLAGRVDALRELPFGDKPVLLKESGLPSGPEPFSEALQARYWQAWFAARPNSTELATVIFEAFDAPWKPSAIPGELSAVEAHWGAFRHDLSAKPVVGLLPR